MGWGRLETRIFTMGAFDNFTPELSDTFQLLDLTGGTASSCAQV